MTIHAIPEKINPNRISHEPYSLKAEKTLHRVTFNPSNASPGETLYVKIPKLSNGYVYVPGSIALVFNLTLPTDDHANNTVVNNLGRNLVNRMRITYGGEVINDLNRYDLYYTYADLFKLVREREYMLEEGVSSENMRKLRTGAGDKVETNAKEVALSKIFGNKYRIPISHEILDDHGVINMKALNDDLLFEITLAESKAISITSDATKPYAYSLSNLELEYEAIQSGDLFQDAAMSYQVGKGFYYENILLHKSFTIAKKTDSVINQHVNVPRRSLSGILMLFVDPYAVGARDSEKFVNPDITKIEVNIDGMPNKLYSKGMLQTDTWGSVIRRYGLSDNITLEGFYSDKYAVWIDLRTFHDNNSHGAGLQLNSTKDGVRLTITRKVSTGVAANITCYMYIVGDALLEIQNSNLKAIMY